MTKEKKGILSKVSALALIASAFGFNHKTENSYPKLPEFDYKTVSGNTNQDYLSIANAGDYNKRNNQLFKLRYKAAQSYIPKNSKNNGGSII
jgi:hypothetical protein